ncbi:MAG: PCP reductase family protein [Candidatus Tectomicrobia bacterium]|nr:PCP reductase family protein [Candidatus Tectomicrobia bacterium]
MVRTTLVTQREGAFQADSQKANDELIWTDEAEKRIERVPLFVRRYARMGIEKFARENGYREITLAVMDEARGKIGM